MVRGKQVRWVRFLAERDDRFCGGRAAIQACRQVKRSSCLFLVPGKPRFSHIGHDAWHAKDLDGAPGTIAPADRALGPVATACESCLPFQPENGKFGFSSRPLNFFAIYPFSCFL